MNLIWFNVTRLLMFWYDHTHQLAKNFCEVWEHKREEEEERRRLQSWPLGENPTSQIWVLGFDGVWIPGSLESMNLDWRSFFNLTQLLKHHFFFHKFSFPLEFPQFSGWHYPPVSPEPEVLQQRSPVPWCLARPRREAPLPASRLGCGRCGAAASGVPTVGRGLWGGEGSWFCHGFSVVFVEDWWDEEPTWTNTVVIFLFGFGKYHKLAEACRFVN